jgi:hypothetical protein
MSYRLELSHQAKKTLKLLDKATIKCIERRFIELSLAPCDFRLSKPLEMGGSSTWSMRLKIRSMYFLLNLVAKPIVDFNWGTVAMPQESHPVHP